MDHVVMLDGEGITYAKALQIYLKESPYLIIGGGGRKHHEMLKIFLTDNKIHFIERMLKGPNFGPTMIGENYRLVGAGWVDLNYKDRIELSGWSDSYGISTDEKHARDISDVLQDRQVEVKKSKPVVIEKIERAAPDLDDFDDGLPF